MRSKFIRKRINLWWIVGVVLLSLPFNKASSKTHKEVTFKDCLSHNSCKYLTEVVYYEARGEPLDGMEAVADVVINRATHSFGRFPNSVKGVVTQKCEFSYRCDGSMYKQIDQESWLKAMQVAIYKLQSKGKITDALFYHNVHVKPFWSKKFKMDKVIGNHKFYICKDNFC